MQMQKNKKSGLSSLGFILSAIGAAVGLGNLWGFPTKMLTYGGTAFLIPYLIAVVCLGFPLMLLEINLGNKWRKTPVEIYPYYLGKRSGRLFGWLQTTVQLMIGTYYGVIISWIVVSLFIPIFSSFGEPTYFDESILGITSAGNDSFFGLGRIQPLLLLVFFGVIFGSVLIVSFGVEKGIEKANKIMVPALFVLLVFFFIYSLNMKGASRGLSRMFTFDITKITSGKAWSTAFGQALFTLSLCEAIIIVYSSHSPKDGDNGNRAITIVAGDTLIALLACVVVSAALGNAEELNIVRETREVGSNIDKFYFVETDILENGFAQKDASPVSGSAYVFKMFPQVFKNINQTASHLGSFLGVFFYITLLFAAISTLISLTEPMVATLIRDKKISRRNAVFIAGAVQFAFGFCFLTQKGSNLIDITDGIFISWLLLFMALVELGIFAFSYRNSKEIYAHNNANSFLKLGKWLSVLMVFSWSIVLFIFGFGIYDATFGKFSETVKGWSAAQWLISTAFFFVPFGYFTIYNGLFTKPPKPLVKPIVNAGGAA